MDPLVANGNTLGDATTIGDWSRQSNFTKDDASSPFGGETKFVPSCYAIFDLEPLSLSFDFVFTSEISISLSFSLDRLCHLAILCLDQHAHTLHHLESLLTISLDNHCLDNLDILKEDLEYQSFAKSDSAGIRNLHLYLYMNPDIKQLAIKHVDEYGFVIRPDLVRLTFGSVGMFYSINTVPVIRFTMLASSHYQNVLKQTTR
ncbi:hypothetical protein Tco_0238097 [Tanacetum coccineum]